MASGDLIRTVRTVAALKPLSLSHTERHVPEGSTIIDALRAFGDVIPGLTYTAAVDGEPVEVVDWFSRRLRHGQTLALGCAPTGGGGEGRDKDVLRSVLSLAAFAGAFAITGGAAGALIPFGVFGKAAIMGGLIAGGSALVNLMVPRPPTDEIDTPSIAPVLNASNVLKAYAPIPNIYGRMRVYPMHAALPYADWHGQDGFVTYLFVIGYGYLEVEVDSLRFSDTAFGDIAGIEYEILPGSSSDADRTLFPPLENNEALSEDLTLGAWSSIEYTIEDADEILCEVTFPAGFLWRVPGQFRWAAPDATVQILATEHDSATWSIIATQTRRAPEHGMAFVASAHKYTSELPTGQAQYDVRVRVLYPTPPSGADWVLYGTAQWTLLRTYNHSDPISCDTGPNPKYVATIGVKVPVTQTEGIDNGLDGFGTDPRNPGFNCIVKRHLMIWDDIGGWSGPTYTNNPAWAYVDLMKGQSNNRPITDSKIDLVQILAWAEWCDTVVESQDQWTCHGLFDRQRTVHQNLGAVASCGQASFFIADNKYSVIWDYERGAPDGVDVIQHITPRNSWGFSASKVFPPEIHGLRVKYLNPNEEWVVDEVTVYYTGYTSANATKFETVEFWGCADDEEAWRHGRYMLGDAQLRLQTIQLNMDIEHLVCQRGDLVQVTHDVPMHGLGFARVESKTEATGDVTHITVDDKFYMVDDGTRYGVRSRLTSSGQSVRKEIVNPGSTDWYDTLEYTAQFPTAGVEIGDLVQFGKYSAYISAPYLVAHIEPTGDLHARLTLIEYDAGVYGYGAIPAYSSNVTTPPDIERMGPGTPEIVAIQSDEAVLYQDITGTLMPQIAISIKHPVGQYLPPHVIHVQRRERVEDPPNDDILTAWSATEVFGVDTNSVYVKGVVQGHIYDVRLRAVSSNNRPSPWVVCTDDTYPYLEVVGKSTPPPAPESLTMEETVLRWAYDDDTKPVDFAGFEVRHHQGSTPQWIYATKLHEHYVPHTSFSVRLNDGGEHTFYVKAVDTSGNYSNQSASLTTEFPEPEIENQAAQREHTSVPHGAYSVTGGEQLPDSTYRATGSPGNYDEMTVTSIIFNYSTNPAYADVIYHWINTHEVTASTYRFEYRQNALGDEDEPGPWLAWTGKIATSGASELNKGIQLRGITAGGTIQGHITDWKTTIMWPTKREILSEVHIGSNGTVLGPLLTKQFSVVVAVNVTILVDGTAMSWRLTNHNPAFLRVTLYDEGGVNVAGEIDAEIIGYYNAQ